MNDMAGQPQNEISVNAKYVDEATIVRSTAFTNDHLDASTVDNPMSYVNAKCHQIFNNWAT